MTCKDCIHYDICLLHEDNFIDDAKKNGFCGKFKNKSEYAKVVQCKDCKHYEKSSLSPLNFCNQHSASLDLFYVQPDDYCSYSERKEEI